MLLTYTVTAVPFADSWIYRTSESTSSRSYKNPEDQYTASFGSTATTSEASNGLGTTSIIINSSESQTFLFSTFDIETSPPRTVFRQTEGSGTTTFDRTWASFLGGAGMTTSSSKLESRETSYSEEGTSQSTTGTDVVTFTTSSSSGSTYTGPSATSESGIVYTTQTLRTTQTSVFTTSGITNTTTNADVNSYAPDPFIPDEVFVPPQIPRIYTAGTSRTGYSFSYETDFDDFVYVGTSTFAISPAGTWVSTQFEADVSTTATTTLTKILTTTTTSGTFLTGAHGIGTAYNSPDGEILIYETSATLDAGSVFIEPSQISVTSKTTLSSFASLTVELTTTTALPTSTFTIPSTSILNPLIGIGTDATTNEQWNRNIYPPSSSGLSGNATYSSIASQTSASIASSTYSLAGLTETFNSVSSKQVGGRSLFTRRSGGRGLTAFSGARSFYDTELWLRTTTTAGLVTLPTFPSYGSSSASSATNNTAEFPFQSNTTAMGATLEYISAGSIKSKGYNWRAVSLALTQSQDIGMGIKFGLPINQFGGVSPKTNMGEDQTAAAWGGDIGTTFGAGVMPRASARASIEALSPLPTRTFMAGPISNRFTFTVAVTEQAISWTRESSTTTNTTVGTLATTARVFQTTSSSGAVSDAGQAHRVYTAASYGLLSKWAAGTGGDQAVYQGAMTLTFQNGIYEYIVNSGGTTNEFSSFVTSNESSVVSVDGAGVVFNGGIFTVSNSPAGTLFAPTPMTVRRFLRP
jgi:hypothetical protein